MGQKAKKDEPADTFSTHTQNSR